MASSPDDQTSAKQTLNPSINGNDAPCPPQEHVGDEELKPSVPQSTDVIESGEKRKRSDPADSDNCRHPLWKTSLCSYFRSHSGSCSHGDACRYAHGEEELRQRPDNTWDPTSERAKKLLKSESGEKCDSKEDDVMMTEAVVDDGCADPGLSKCLLHLPLKWHSDQLRDFLGQQASGVFFLEFFLLLCFKRFLPVWPPRRRELGEKGKKNENLNLLFYFVFVMWVLDLVSFLYCSIWSARKSRRRKRKCKLPS